MSTEAVSKTSPGRWQLQGPLAGVVILAVSILVCIPVFRAVFVLADHELASPAPTSLLGLPDTDKSASRVEWLSPDKVAMWIEWRIFRPSDREHAAEASPAGYHVVSAILHAAAALLLWRVLVRLAVPGAVLAAAVFAVHPVNIETVAWIAQQKFITAFIFLLLGLLAWVRHEDTRKPNWYFTACLAFLLAFLSNPLLVTFPLVLPLLAWWRRGKLDKADMFRAVPLVVLAGAVAVLGLHGQGTAGAPAGRLADAPWAIWFYTQKALLPLKLSLVYQMPPATSVLRACLSLAGVVGLLVALWAMQDTLGRGLMIGVAGYLLLLAPALFWPDAFRQYAVVTDHWQYAPLAFLVAGIVGTLAQALAALTELQKLVVGAVCVVGLGTMAALRGDVYKSDDSLWSNVVAENPASWYGHTHLALIHLGQVGTSASGNDDELMRDVVGHLKAALAAKPDSFDARTNLAGIYLHEAMSLSRMPGASGDLFAERARDEYRLAISQHPRDPEVYKMYVNLGAALWLLRDAPGCETAMRKAIDTGSDRAITPGGMDARTELLARRRLAQALELQGRLDEGVEQYLKAVRLASQDPVMRFGLGSALARRAQAAKTPSDKRDRYEDAIKQLEEAVKLSGNDPAAVQKLADVRREWRATTAPATTQTTTAPASQASGGR